MITIAHGDNLEQMSRLESGSVTLAYLDPPFCTQRQFFTKDKALAFDDRWPDRGTYIDALMLRVREARRLLADHGSMVVHIDPRTSHYVKVACDGLFGEECFASEIVWRYRRWSVCGGNFARVHDVLLRYVRSASHPARFNQMFEPLAPSTRAKWGTGRQRAVVGPNGKRTRSVTTAEESPGVPMGDVWDVGIIAPSATERTGYPTQKPEALVERLVLGLTNPGELVLDPYCGSGTAVAVAQRLGRHAFGIDSSELAFNVALKRLKLKGGIVRLQKGKRTWQKNN